MMEHEIEPVRGLPGHLPAGEAIVWQGAPEWRSLARRAFGTRLVAAYFALLALWALASVSNGRWQGVEITLALGAVALGLLHALAWASARSTVYTLTNRRIVLRVGIAVPKCINLPLSLVEAVDLASHRDGTGDIALRLAGSAKLGIVALWPHARPWMILRPQPMLRGIADAGTVAALVSRACLAVNPDGRITAVPAASTTPSGNYGEVAQA